MTDKAPPIYDDCAECGGRVTAKRDPFGDFYTGAVLHVHEADWVDNPHHAVLKTKTIPAELIIPTSRLRGATPPAVGAAAYADGLGDSGPPGDDGGGSPEAAR